MSFPGDYAGTLNSLAFGGGSPYDLQAVTGWHDMAQSPLGGSGSVSPKQTRNGSWFMPYFMPSRVVTMALQIEDVAAGFAASIAGLEAATQPGIGEIPLALQMDGVASTVNGVVSARTIPTTLDYLAGYTLAQIEVTCSDPRRFGTPLIGSTQLPSSTGGIAWPLKWALTWTATQTTGQVNLVNPGNAAGPVTMRINGPVTAPTVLHVQSGTQFAMAPTFTVAAGDWLEIDCEARTVLYNGQSSRNGSILTRGWLPLVAGRNSYLFNAASYNSAAQLIVTALPSWL
jgi:hypothetical protein